VVEAGGERINVEIAASAEARKRGFMRRAAPGKLEGMLFVFTDEAERRFWNHDVSFSVDIAFLDSSGRVVSTAKMEPLDDTIVSSRAPARFALEMRSGAFARLGISRDSFVKIPREIAEIEVEP